MGNSGGQYSGLEEMDFMKDVLPTSFSNGFSLSENGRQVISTFATFALKDMDSAMNPSVNWWKYELARSALKFYERYREGDDLDKDKLRTHFNEIWRNKMRARRVSQNIIITDEQLSQLERYSK